MVRKISFRNQRRPPPIGQAGEVDQVESQKYQRQTADDLRRDLVEVSSTSPDMRDRVSFVSVGPGENQRVAHGMPYKPDLFIVGKVQHEGDESVSVWETRDADSKYLYLKSTAPKGCKITLILYPRA